MVEQRTFQQKVSWKRLKTLSLIFVLPVFLYMLLFLARGVGLGIAIPGQALVGMARVLIEVVVLTLAGWLGWEYLVFRKQR